MPDKSWWGDDRWSEDYGDPSKSMQIEDVPLAQPIGFIWTYKPRYRVKAVSRIIAG